MGVRQGQGGLVADVRIPTQQQQQSSSCGERTVARPPRRPQGGRSLPYIHDTRTMNGLDELLLALLLVCELLFERRDLLEQPVHQLALHQRGGPTLNI